MNSKNKLKKQQRLRDIEDRKIEILLQIAKINNNYNEQVSHLNSEYEQLHEEHYKLQMELIRKKDALT